MMKHDIKLFQRDLEEDAENHIAQKVNGSQFRNSFVRVSYHSDNYLDTRERINSQQKSIRSVPGITRYQTPHIHSHCRYIYIPGRKYIRFHCTLHRRGDHHGCNIIITM